MIRFHYQPTLADYRALNHHFMRKSSGFALHLLSLPVIAALAYPFLAAFYWKDKTPVLQTYQDTPLLWIVPAFAIAFFILVRVSVSRAFAGNPAIHEPRDITFGESGITVSQHSGHHELPWHRVRSWEIARGYFFIKVDASAYIYFPESTPPDRDALIALLDRKTTR